MKIWVTTAQTIIIAPLLQRYPYKHSPNISSPKRPFEEYKFLALGNLTVIGNTTSISHLLHI